ncbi:DUF421 domain-containing protein [Anaerobacillus sp. MEB173]|uniref:DUF421 domain-containing protein n=1 Tax=Anaerobacillus sp. MEB173 TaxID=3383345 RepID=UPI003F922C5F
MHYFSELLIIFGRILTILPLLLLITLYMGRRSAAELPVFDFLVIITLASVTGADIADPNIHHLHTAFAIVMIGFLQRIVSNLTLKKRKLGKFITFDPTVVIKDGYFLNKNLKKIRYPIDDILEMLREKDIFDIQDVELGIVEASGNLTVYKKPAKTTVTIEDIGLIKKESGMSYPVIIEGMIDDEVLQEVNLTRADLKQHLKQRGITDINSVFFASINKKRELHVSLVNQNQENVPPINH